MQTGISQTGISQTGISQTDISHLYISCILQLCFWVFFTSYTLTQSKVVFVCTCHLECMHHKKYIFKTNIHL
jgi:hypothetical protein